MFLSVSGFPTDLVFNETHEFCRETISQCIVLLLLYPVFYRRDVLVNADLQKPILMINMILVILVILVILIT